MILICAALSAELKIAKELRAKKGRQFLCTGLGNYKTIYTLTKYLTEYPNVTEVLFVGVCGWYGEKRDLVQVANVINAHTKKEIIIPIHHTYAPLVTLLSSETPVHESLGMEKQQYVDMESRGVALVVEQFRLPCTILRMPIDEIGTGNCTTFDRVGAIDEMKRVLTGLTLFS